MTEKITRREFLTKSGAAVLFSLSAATVGTIVGYEWATKPQITEEEAWRAVGYESWPGVSGRYEWYQESPE